MLLKISLVNSTLILSFKPFLKYNGADHSASSLTGFSDKLDFLEGDQKSVPPGTKAAAKSQQMKKG